MKVISDYLVSMLRRSRDVTLDKGIDWLQALELMDITEPLYDFV